jgi:ABC-type transporter Mla MlaB component
VDCSGLSLLLAARNSYSGPPKRIELVNVQPSLVALLETLRLKEPLNARME